MINKKIGIYTDGACSGNPGPGAWAYVYVTNDISHTCSGFEHETTNNRMEMMGAIKALKLLKEKHSMVTVHTDSKYVKNGITQWIKNWIKNGWRTAAGKDVKNKDLWMVLHSLCNYHTVTWQWVKGHNGNKYNEMADQVAVQKLKQNI